MTKAYRLIKSSLPETLPSPHGIPETPLGTFSNAHPVLAHDNTTALPVIQLRSLWFPPSASITTTTRITHNNFHRLSSSSNLHGSLTPGLRAPINPTVADNMLLNNPDLLIPLRKCLLNNTVHKNLSTSPVFATSAVPLPLCRSTNGVMTVAQISRFFSPGSTLTILILTTHILLRKLTMVRAPPATLEIHTTASCTRKSGCPRPLTSATLPIGLQMSGRMLNPPS